MKTILLVLLFICFANDKSKEILKIINNPAFAYSDEKQNIINASYPLPFIIYAESIHIILPKEVVWRKDSVFYKHYWFNPDKKFVWRTDDERKSIDDIEGYLNRTKGKTKNEEGDWVEDTVKTWADYECYYLLSAKEYKEKKAKK